MSDTTAHDPEDDRIPDREALIALASWWSGWCTDNDGTLPDLAKLGGFLLVVKHRIALDRAPEPTTSEGESSSGVVPNPGTTAQDREALAKVLETADVTADLFSEMTHFADAILGSAWLAALLADARAEGAKAVLDLHRQTPLDICEHCWALSRVYDVDRIPRTAEWPCPTVAAIRQETR